MLRREEKVLIVNADDFGITEGVTDAIIECHRAGAVTSTTLMANMSAARYAVQLAKKNPSLGVGLHFNITLGQPVAAKPSSLTDDDGVFFSRRDFILRAISGRIRSSDLKSELEAQHAAMGEFGLAPTHIDSHQHVHAIPGVFQVVAAFAEKHRLPMRMPWGWIGRVEGKPLKRVLKETILKATLGYLDRVRPPSVSVNDGLCSVFDLGIPPAQLTLEHYRTLLASYRKGVVELMVHPAYVDEALLGRTEIAATSDVEKRLLMDPGFAELAAALGYRLATFREIDPGRH